MARKLIAMALCLVLLSSCAPIVINVEDLLRPPRLNERQTQIEQALQNHIRLDSIRNQYPREGDYRSPFVFRDMDGNGLLAAFVFYTPVAPVEGGAGIRFKVLREQRDGHWRLTDDRAGFGDQVHIVQFANLLSPDELCLLVGWEDSDTGQRRLDVFSFQNERLHMLYTTAYTIFDIGPYKAGDLEQIALVRQSLTDAFQLHLLGRTLDGRLSLLGEAYLSADTREVLGLTKGFMRDDEINGIFVDARRFSDGHIATELFEVSTEEGAFAWLSTLVADVETEVINRIYRQTFRTDDRLLSVDLRGDGRVLIPVNREYEYPMPGLFAEAEPEAPPLTFYLRFNYAGFLEVEDIAVVNAEAGYLFFFPERWVGNVTVLRRPEVNEWQFWEVDPRTNLRTAELLRIRVYSVRDYPDRQISEYYTRLADRGLFQYYGYLPNSDSEFALTQLEMETNFMLL